MDLVSPRPPPRRRPPKPVHPTPPPGPGWSKECLGVQCAAPQWMLQNQKHVQSALFLLHALKGAHHAAPTQPARSVLRTPRQHHPTLPISPPSPNEPLACVCSRGTCFLATCRRRSQDESCTGYSRTRSWPRRRCWCWRTRWTWSRT